MWYDPGPNKIENPKQVSQEELKHSLQNLDKNKFPPEVIAKSKSIVELMDKLENKTYSK